jgi:hypothetical protein
MRTDACHGLPPLKFTVVGDLLALKPYYVGTIATYKASRIFVQPINIEESEYRSIQLNTLIKKMVIPTNTTV